MVWTTCPAQCHQAAVPQPVVEPTISGSQSYAQPMVNLAIHITVQRGAVDKDTAVVASEAVHSLATCPPNGCAHGQICASNYPWVSRNEHKQCAMQALRPMTTYFSMAWYGNLIHSWETDSCRRHAVKIPAAVLHSASCLSSKNDPLHSTASSQC